MEGTRYRILYFITVSILNRSWGWDEGKNRRVEKSFRRGRGWKVDEGDIDLGWREHGTGSCISSLYQYSIAGQLWSLTVASVDYNTPAARAALPCPNIASLKLTAHFLIYL